jgi:Flp pilus assembly protein TadG
MRIVKKFQQFTQESRGASLVEFTLLLPLLIVISLGIYETTHYVMLKTKLNEIAQGIATWVSAETSTATITDCLIGANLMGTNYNFSKAGGVVVSGLQQVGTTSAQQLVWQQASTGATSTITTNSTTGDVTSAPFTILLDTKVIVVEVSYNYSPVFTYFLTIFPSVKLLKVAQTVPIGTTSFNPLSPT